MNNRTGIIMGSILVLVFAALGTAWYYMIMPTFENYKKDEKKCKILEDSVKGLQESFGGYKPDLLVNLWVDGVQPWRDARTERSAYFTFGDWYKYEETEDKSRLLKFWYGDVVNKMVQDFYTRVYEKMGRYDLVPQDIRATFGVATEQDFQGNVTDDEVRANLLRLVFGIKACDYLIDHKVSQLSALVLWPRHTAGDYRDMLVRQVLGVQCTIAMKDMVKLLEDLRTADRYFSINAIKVTYPYIAYDVEPQLEVSFLLSQMNYMKNKVEGGEGNGAGKGAGVPGAPPRVSEIQQIPVAEPSALGKSWKWFKNNILYIH